MMARPRRDPWTSDAAIWAMAAKAAKPNSSEIAIASILPTSLCSAVTKQSQLGSRFA
jgi:hypothetical protein